MANEIEIKFRIEDVKSLTRELRREGFHLRTKSTHEMNTLYDLPGGQLRRKGDLLRLRKYGPHWVLTHKTKGSAGRHKKRVETETAVENGTQMHKILQSLGFRPSFHYEKFRAEWNDETGHVVIDQTPIGNFGEIEGPARWIDRTARALGITPDKYITATYADLFFQWKKQTGSAANEMTFKAIKSRSHRR